MWKDLIRELESLLEFNDKPLLPLMFITELILGYILLLIITFGSLAKYVQA
jgi:hypothetical protein